MGYIQELRKLVGTRPIILTGASVIVFNERNEILLQQRSDTGDWGVIGGSIELGESFEEAAARELYEEAGLTAQDLTFKCMLSGSDMYYKYPHGDEIYNVTAVFETRDYMGVPTILDDEGLDLQFFDVQTAPPPLNPMAVQILTKAKYIAADSHDPHDPRDLSPNAHD